jgi:hypothetical protein
VDFGSANHLVLSNHRESEVGSSSFPQELHDALASPEMVLDRELGQHLHIIRALLVLLPAGS